MRRQHVLASRNRPAVEIINSFNTFDSHDVFANVIHPDVTGRAFHEDLEALKEDVVGGEHDDDREEVRADWVDDFPFGPDVDYDCGNNDADGLQQITDEMHNGCLEVEIVTKVVVF